jgi:amidophosphoribosyltransferase
MRQIEHRLTCRRVRQLSQVQHRLGGERRDFASPGELIANGLSVDDIRVSIDADSLAFISLEGLVAASEQPMENLCRACFDGVYPVELPEPELLGKHLLEVDPAR